MAKDKLSKQTDRHLQRLQLDELEKKYKKYLDKNDEKNSFEQGERFIKKREVSQSELKTYGVTSFKDLISKLTGKKAPASWAGE